MGFSTLLFLIGLFPLLLLGCLCLRKHNKLCNILILITNIVFYMFGGAGFTAFLFLVCFVVWILSKLVLACKDIHVWGRVCFVLAIIVVSTPLLFAKYAGFFVDTINTLCGTQLPVYSATLPLGISFYTFHAISLIADVYTGKIQYKTSFFRVLFYLTFFPTVVSGPITRFNDLFSQINNKKITRSNLQVGLERLIIGLFKKMILANTLATLANYAFDSVAISQQISTLGLWLGSFAYTMQLYFDFSGYSDMAIGVAKILGFDLQKNFEHPYIAVNIQDFWKRWHISLSRWFRDYVYFPLGGSRVSPIRHILNLLCVWCFTGIWHGANWTFVIWGLLYFVLLVFEKYGGKVAAFLSKGMIGHIYTLFFVNLLWVFFRAPSVGCAFRYIGGMFGYTSCNISVEPRFLRFIPFLLLSALLCMPITKRTERWKDKIWYKLVEVAVLICLLVLSLGALVNEQYAPFIYGGF